jgi:hypothetical protein
VTRDELCAAGVELYGAWGWQTRMAEALSVDGSTVRRWVSGAVPIPGPTEAALTCFLARKRESERKTRKRR